MERTASSVHDAVRSNGSTERCFLGSLRRTCPRNKSHARVQAAGAAAGAVKSKFAATHFVPSQDALLPKTYHHVFTRRVW